MQDQNPESPMMRPVVLVGDDGQPLDLDAFLSGARRASDARLEQGEFEVEVTATFRLRVKAEGQGEAEELADQAAYAGLTDKFEDAFPEIRAKVLRQGWPWLLAWFGRLSTPYRPRRRQGR